MKRSVLALATAALVLLPVGAAYAHAEIKSLSPKPGATASTSITHVTARFKEAIVAGSLNVHKGTRKVSIGQARLIKSKTGLRARLRGDLTAGKYKANMKWLSDDGHVQRKTWTFTLR
jgi:methionine-rich copper-binding protein CopC